MGSTAAIIIAIVAVVAGFLILRSIGDDDDDGGTLSDSTTTVAETVPSSVTQPQPTQPTTPPSTEFVPTVDGATAVVANASTVDGAAGRLTTALLGKNFTMGEATNASLKVEDSLVYYDSTDPEAEAVAKSIAFYMGGIEVQAMPAPPPVTGGTLTTGVSILVMLGNDRATLTLDAMSTPTTSVASSTPAGDTGNSSSSTAAP
jgi:hypothetical protein